MRSEAQLQGDQDKRDTGKARRHLKAKLEENEDFVPLAIQEVDHTPYTPFTTNDIFYAWLENRDAIKGLRGLSNVRSSSINRSPIHEHNYFDESDNIDVPTTYPDLKSIDEGYEEIEEIEENEENEEEEEEEKEENEENEEKEENDEYIPAQESRLPRSPSAIMTRAKTHNDNQKARAKRRTPDEIEADSVLIAENKLKNARQKQAVKDAAELEKSNKREQKALAKAIADERKEAEKKLAAFVKTKTTKPPKNASDKNKFK
jgi:chemotaxis protein histidine kinase CheA